MNKKILLVNDYYSEGGAEGVCRKIEETVNNKGGSISFFYGAKDHCLPPSPLEYIHSRYYFKKFYDKILEFTPDIIHLHNYYHLLSPSILRAIKECRREGVFHGRVIMTAHDYHLLCPDSGLYYNTADGIVPHKDLPTYWDLLTKRYDTRSRAYSMLKKMQWIFNYIILGLHNQIDTFTSPSYFLKKKYAEKFPGKDIHVIRNPYDISIYTDKENKRNRQSDILKLVFLGRVSAEKGIKEFVRSLNEADFPNYRFDIIGDGPDTGEIKALVDRLDLHGKIKLLGRIPYEHVIEKISHYDTLVLPSLWVENAPLVLVEAVIARIRILTSKWGGMKELAELCGGSYLMNPRKSESVEGSLKDIYRDIFEEDKSLNRNIEKIKKEFSEELFIKKITDSYKNID